MLVTQAAGGGESLRLEGRIARLAPASTDPRLLTRLNQELQEPQRQRARNRPALKRAKPPGTMKALRGRGFRFLAFSGSPNYLSAVADFKDCGLWAVAVFSAHVQQSATAPLVLPRPPKD